MKEKEVLDCYTTDYARGYDDLYLFGERKPHTQFEIDTLRRLMPKSGRWLDVASGSGFFLSHFPEADRAGLDLSPGMIEVAASRNPGVPFTQGSFLDPHPEWESAWELVSCMGSAYVVVETLDQIRTLIGNLARWTSPSGHCFLPINPSDKLNGASIPYETFSPFGGRILITGITWTYYDEKGKVHPDLIAPQEPWLVEQFAQYFDHVEPVVYPRIHPEWEPIQRGLVAWGKRP